MPLPGDGDALSLRISGTTPASCGLAVEAAGRWIAGGSEPSSALRCAAPKVNCPAMSAVTGPPPAESRRRRR
jgi:hypothetical protein